MSTSRKLTGLPSASTRGDCSQTAQPSSCRSVATTSDGAAAGSSHARANAADRSAWSVWRTTCQASPRSRTIIVALSCFLAQGTRPPAALHLADDRRDGRRPERLAVDLDLAGVGVDPDARAGPRRAAPRPAPRSIGRPRLTQLRWKMRAKLVPTTRLHAPGLHRLDDVLARGAEAEVRAGDDDRVRPELVAERGVEALEQVLLHLLGILDVQVRARVQHVGVDVVARDHDGVALDDHARSDHVAPGRRSRRRPRPPRRPTRSRGGPRPRGEPIRPLKLRFVVVTARSPAASTPMPPPKQAPQVGVETIAPASTKRSSSPSASASR